MAGFTKNTFRIENVPDKPENWKLLDPIEYHVGSEDSPYKVIVPPGFITDFGSVPEIFRPIIGNIGTPQDKAYVLHDWLYATEYYSANFAYCFMYNKYDNRAECDWVFLEAMQVLGLGWFKRNAIYSAVRWFGGCVWNSHDTESVSGNRNLYRIYMTEKLWNEYDRKTDKRHSS